MQSLRGRHVVLTGASGGLGGAVLEQFLAAGASCHVPTHRAGEIDARPGLRVVAGVDLTDEAAVTDFYADCPALWASVHLAGGYAGAAVVDTTLADLRRQLDLNVVTAFLCCREAVRNMARSAPGAGRIVNVSSRAADVPGGGAIAYAMAKAAVSQLTRSLAVEVAERGVLVNAVAPSIIDTPANRRAMPGADHARWPAPAQLAQTIAWLASPDNALTTGTVVPVYGNA